MEGRQAAVAAGVAEEPDGVTDGGREGGPEAVGGKVRTSGIKVHTKGEEQRGKLVRNGGKTGEQIARPREGGPNHGAVAEDVLDGLGSGDGGRRGAAVAERGGRGGKGGGRGGRDGEARGAAGKGPAVDPAGKTLVLGIEDPVDVLGVTVPEVRGEGVGKRAEGTRGRARGADGRVRDLCPG